VAALLALGPAPARAQERHWALEAGAGPSRFDYAELSAQGRVIDAEAGWIPALRVGAGLGFDAWFVAATGDLAWGEVRYEGETQSSSPALDGLAIRSTTRARFARAELSGGRWLGSGRRWAAVAGAGGRRWDRAIQPTTVVSRTGAVSPVTGLDEVYRWGELFAGLRAGWEPLGWLRLELEARFVHGVLPRVEVDWGGERVVLPLGPRPGWRTTLRCDVDVGAGWAMVVAAEGEGHRFGASRLDPGSGLVEPASRTVGLALSARVARRF
jgi:hypothetical protein